jgi:putative FmdB family regulatory protein
MPLYEYSCGKCGPFKEFQTMNRWSEPFACPDCGTQSARTISAPQISNVNPHTRIANQRNELSADQPKVMKKKAHEHGAACTHKHPHARPGGNHKHGPSRPWMIGH